MSDKPAWYKTSDMARIYVGAHTEGIRIPGLVIQEMADGH